MRSHRSVCGSALILVSVAFLLGGCPKVTTAPPPSVHKVHIGFNFATAEIEIGQSRYFIQITWSAKGEQVERGVVFLVPAEQRLKFTAGIGTDLDAVNVSAEGSSLDLDGFKGKVVLYDLETRSVRLLSDSWPESFCTEWDKSKLEVKAFLERVLASKRTALE